MPLATLKCMLYQSKQPQRVWYFANGDFKFISWNFSEFPKVIMVERRLSVPLGLCYYGRLHCVVVLACFTGLLQRHQGSSGGRQRQTGHPYLGCSINDFPSTTARPRFLPFYLTSLHHQLTSPLFYLSADCYFPTSVPFPAHPPQPFSSSSQAHLCTPRSLLPLHPLTKQN